MQAAALDDPSHAPPRLARVRIAFEIRFLMMDAVRGDPEDRTAFERERAAPGQEVFDPFGRLVTAVVSRRW